MTVCYESDIEEFWDWFSQKQFSALQLPTWPIEFVRELEKRLHNFGITSWEYRAPKSPSDKPSLTFSPSGDPDLVAVCQLLVAGAPSDLNWDFFAFKQPKCWARKFRWGKERTSFDAGKWGMIVFQYPDGLHEIVVDIDSCEPDTTEGVVWFALESELGEKVVMNEIACVSIEPISANHHPFRLEELASILNDESS